MIMKAVWLNLDDYMHITCAEEWNENALCQITMALRLMFEIVGCS